MTLSKGYSRVILPKCLKKPFPKEINEIRKLSRICDEGLATAHNAIEAGKREYEIAAEVDHAVKKLGVTEFNFPGQRSKYYGQRGARLTPLRRQVLELVWLSHRPAGAPPGWCANCWPLAATR